MRAARAPLFEGAAQGRDEVGIIGVTTPGRSLKKSGKSIKEKRVERRIKADTSTQVERLTRHRKS